MHKMRHYFKILLVAALLESVALARVCVTQVCHCTNITDGSVSVTCRLQNLTDLSKHLQEINKVSSLDLSSSQVYAIPISVFVGFDSLINLSLADNKIQAITTGKSFAGLSNLLHLDLSNNKIQKWEGEISTHLQRLETIDVTGNKNWIPGSNVLALKHLQKLKGVTWLEACSNCSLIRNYAHGDIEMDNLKSGVFYRGREGDCRATKYTIAKELKTFATHGFYPSCLKEGGKCYESMIDVRKIHRCWDIDNYILNLEYVIGPIALVLNIIVILNTLTDKNLRRNVSLLLVTNMAVSDLCICVYSIVLTTARKISYERFLTIMNGLCPSVGFIWLVGQCVTVTTSALLTIERYLAIVFCMAPAIRLRLKTAIACIAGFWVIALIVAILPTVGIGVYTSNTYCVPVRPIRDIPHMFELSIGIGSAAILLYLATIPLYIHIYVFVKRSSSTSRGIKKDCCLARRIAVMVLSNMLFFCIPVFIGLLWIMSNITKGLSPVAKEIITGVIPTICFTINSLINPLLYAFRNERFMHALRVRVQLCRSRARSMSLSWMSNSRSRSRSNPIDCNVNFKGCDSPATTRI